jgi:hypothetical protein
MKNLNFEEMEKINGGNLLDGACAIFGLTAGGLAVKFLVGATLAIPGWGQIVLAVGTVGCSVYALVK